MLKLSVAAYLFIVFLLSRIPWRDFAKCHICSWGRHKFTLCMPWGCWWATDGLCNWHGVQSQHGAFEVSVSPLWIVCWDWGHQGDMAWSGTESMTRHSTLPPHTVLFRVDGDSQFDLRKQYSCLNCCRFNTLKRVCECLLSLFCQKITFLAPLLMHAM